MSTMDKVKHALHLDKDHSTSTTHTTGHTTGTHTGTAEGVAGPHNSRVANAADPRVDSDMDHSRTAGATHNTHSGVTGGYTGTGSGIAGSNSTNAGPHNSNLVNKVDPRVDSDRDGSRNVGAASHTGTTGYSGTQTGNHLGTGTTGGISHSTNAGPHNSNLANKVDPRVDSDRDGSRNVGAASHTGTTGYSGTQTGNHLGSTGTTGGISHSTNAGPHNSNLANKADPRVDSDLDSTGNRHGAHTGGIMGTSGSHATPGSGTAQNTAGPHNSDMMNKIDPRVDADLDGSKTFGGNKTHV